MNRREFIKGTACMGSLAAAAMASAEERRSGIPSSADRPAGKDLGKARILPPGRYDEHMHIYEDTDPRPEQLRQRLADAGIAGGCIFSREQMSSPRLKRSTRLTPEQIVDNVIGWCSGSPTLYPFFWIDPSRHDSVDLVDMAAEKGICGFKVIRSNGMPCEGIAADVYRRIAHYGKPLTFHSGILYDGLPSSEYFRPVAFEPLLGVPRLRFCLAHISWPWCDECLAVFGKMRDAGWRLHMKGEEGPSRNVPTMFVDTTPGAHDIWRREAMTHIYQTHFRKGMLDRLMFGIDNSVHDYVVSYSRKYQDFDDALFREWGVTEKEVDSYYRGALQNFLFG